MGKKFDSWEVISQINEGGQSYIYEVKNIIKYPEEKFILKRLKNNKRIDRLKREIGVLNKLDHPNILKIIDFNYECEDPYIVTEYCESGTLEKLNLEKKNLIEKLDIILQICEGLSYAHERGVVHRDLKPSNIFINEKGNPKIGDFGICFFDDDGTRITLLDEAVGPKFYIAPELEDGRLEEINQTSDIYSLGKLFYWMFTGKIFAREKHRDAGFNILEIEDNPYYYTINKMLDRMINANPAERFPNCEELLKMIRTLKDQVEQKFHVIDIDAPQPCLYCGIGSYKKILSPVLFESQNYYHNIQNFGLKSSGSILWQIFACDYCGNVQLFSLRNTRNPDVWGKLKTN